MSHLSNKNNTTLKTIVWISIITCEIIIKILVIFRNLWFLNYDFSHMGSELQKPLSNPLSHSDKSL